MPCKLQSDSNQKHHPPQDVEDLSRERASLLQTCVDQAGMLQALQAAVDALQRGSKQLLAEAEDKV